MADNSFTHLVVVGSSAGGIGALSGLVSSLPDDFDAPIVVAQHLDPNRESHLQEILARKSPLPVKTVTEHEPLQAGVVFVAPSNRHVNITDSEIDLSSEPTSGQPMPSINLLMETAAGVFGENLIAVVLSGTGTDGTEGARTVSQAGGTVIIQDPETAEFGEMPRSLAPSTIDIVSALEEIGPVLKNLVSGIAMPEDSSEEGQDLERFLEELHRNRGVDFRSYKRPTILRRLSRRMVATNCESLVEYSRYLEEHPEEYGRLIGAFLIKVTEFFRDPELFDYLKEEVLPALIEEARAEENQLRIWSAGCATGEEAYSLAILLSEVLGREAGLFNARIYATDIDEDAVRFARRGVYPPSALGGLSEDQIGRYFVDEDGSYQVKKHIRGMIVFGEHDLAQRSPFPHVDLVVSRNVLIYFSDELQRRTLQLFAYSLRNGGFLVLGKAESPSHLADLFAPVDRHNKVYRRHGLRFFLPPTIPADLKSRTRQERSFGDRSVHHDRAETRQQLSAASRTAGEDLLNQLPVGVVVVARDYTIEAINAAARQMLSISGVGVGQDLLHAMQQTPYAEVRRTIDEVFREGRTTQSDAFAVEETATGDLSYLRFTCHPRRAEIEGQNTESVLVAVEDVTATVRMRRLVEKTLRLDEANRELGQINEELQAAHEESLVNSEEAQASAEEVETLNEELQATNEELETLNEELQATVEELNTTNDDLQARATELQELAQSREEERQLTEAGRRRAEGLVDQLQSERSRLEAILVNISDAVLAVDTDEQVLFGNQVFEETFGEHEGAERGLLGSTLVLDESGEKLPPEATPQSRAAGGESFTMRFVVGDEDGALRRFEARGRPIEGDGVAGGVLVIREVTDDHD
ncbi:MAG TPA: CheR family methyltransferase [Rubrobacter sp.]|nr:CheR family methyltransferase [Rubrobacter sp.]